MELEDAHYSDQTLAALIRYHGWRYGDSKRPADGVKRLFSSLTLDGALDLVAGYAADPERRRYISLYAGAKPVVDSDGRYASPAQIA